jgi:FKBP-type peptidyl-prolyl cis-trans isomerase (trigger factor)
MQLVQPKGSAFTGDNKDFIRFKLGSYTMIPGFEEAVQGMKVSKQIVALPSNLRRLQACLMGLYLVL